MARTGYDWTFAALLRSVGTLIVVSLGLLAPVSVAAQTKDPYVINVVLPLTGTAAFSGESHHKTLVELEHYVNEHGGVRGRPIHFDFHDDGSNPTTAVQIVNGILPSKPSVILGSGIVATCSAMAPLMANGPVQYCISPGYSTGNLDSYSFSASTSLNYLVPAMVRFPRDRRVTGVSPSSRQPMQPEQAADKATLDGLKRKENDGTTIVDYQHFNPGDVSVSAQVASMKAARPDAVVAWATGSPFGTVLRALNDGGTQGSRLDERGEHDARTTLPSNTRASFLTSCTSTRFCFSDRAQYRRAPPEEKRRRVLRAISQR